MQRFAVVVAVISLLAACGGGGEDEAEKQSSTASSPRTETSEAYESTTGSPSIAPGDSAKAELEDAYRAYVEAFLTGDASTAYDLLSERCRRATPLSEFAAASEAAADLYGAVDYKINRVEVHGHEGVVDATYPVAALNNDEDGSPWLLEDGDWHSDRCG